MPSIIDKQIALVDSFTALATWEERYAKLIGMARQLTPLPEVHHTDANKVRGCSSNVWLISEQRDGMIHFQADSDAVLVRGLVALLLHVYSGHTPREILGAPPDFLEDMGLNANLSPNRANGLASMAQRIRDIAQAAA